MSAVSCLPDELLSSVFDEFKVMQLVTVSHVCRRWRRIAREHKTFWETAAITKSMTRPVLSFFLARLAEARRRHRPITVTISPDLSPLNTQAQLAILKIMIVPTLSASLGHIASLRLTVPPALAQPMFNALRQPAPVLRKFDVINRQFQSPVCIPLDVFSGSAPQLRDLILGHGVCLPRQPVAGFQTVQLLVYLVASGSPDLDCILDWFPNLRHLDTCTRELTSDSLARLTANQVSQLCGLKSLGLHLESLVELQRLGIAKAVLSQIRVFRLHVTNTSHDQLCSRLCASAAKLLLPTRGELYCWVDQDGTLLAYPVKSQGPLFMRHTYRPYDEHGRAFGPPIPCPSFELFTAYPTLVALSIDLEMWDHLRAFTAELLALEVVVIALSVRLFLPAAQGMSSRYRLIPAPRLRTAVFYCRLPCNSEGVPAIAGPVTCRNVDGFLRATFSMDDWSRVEVLLVNVHLFGAAAVPGTKISGVRVASTEECCALGPRVATLPRHIGHVGRPLVCQ